MIGRNLIEIIDFCSEEKLEKRLKFLRNQKRIVKAEPNGYVGDDVHIDIIVTLNDIGKASELAFKIAKTTVFSILKTKFQVK